MTTNIQNLQEMHLQAGTGGHCEDVPMECVATALDPVDDDTHSPDKELQPHELYPPWSQPPRL